MILSIVQNVVIGRSKQKIGNAVFTTWKGKNVLKSKPLTVENPKTDNQLMRRSALTQTVDYFRLISNVVSVGWKELAVGMSEYNAFTSNTLRNAFNYTSPPNATLLFDSIKISKGTIAGTSISSASASAATDEVTINWSLGTLQPGQSNTDKALIVVIDPVTGAAGFVTNVNRSAETATVTCPYDFALAASLKVYLGFYNPTTLKAADSAYIGITAGA